MKKQYTLLVITGILLQIIVAVFYFVINIFRLYDIVPINIIGIIQIIALLLMLPFFINLYKNQK